MPGLMRTRDTTHTITHTLFFATSAISPNTISKTWQGKRVNILVSHFVKW